MAQKRKASPADIEAKREFIRAYFEERRRQLDRAGKLIRQNEYLFEGVLVLCCHIASYAVLRFPLLSKLSDRKAFKEVVLKYSGKRALYEKIDLLFLYQWQRSHFRGEKAYKNFKNYPDVKKILVSRFGDESELQDQKRYAPKTAILRKALANPFLGLEKENLRRSLPLFSVGEQLYRYLRSFAVHNFRFPFLSRVGDKYVPNHIITPDVLFETAKSILNNLESECLAEGKFPEQLRQIRK
jgi:hypothetical protein